MKCLVTGGPASSARRRPITCGCTVINLDKLTYAANLASLASIAGHPRYQFYRVDICDCDTVALVIDREQPDAVMHLAAESHVDRSIGEPAEFNAEDHARALLAVLERGRPGERYNVGAPSERSNLAVVLAVCDYLDHRLPREDASHHEAICFVTDRPGHDFRYASDPDKIERN